MLSPEEDYSGGQLTYRNLQTGAEVGLDLGLGDVVVCPSEMEHCVTPLRSGTRISVNVDFWRCPSEEDRRSEVDRY